MDSDKIEARKSLLESFLKVSILLFGLVCPSHHAQVKRSTQNWLFLLKFTLCLLQQLCAVPELTNSEEVQEFLALNTDARIAFVKKPRIDKVWRDHMLRVRFPFGWRLCFQRRGGIGERLHRGVGTWSRSFQKVCSVITCLFWSPTCRITLSNFEEVKARH